MSDNIKKIEAYYLQDAYVVRPIQHALVYNRSKGRLDSFMEKAKGEFPSIQFEIAETEAIMKDTMRKK